jgi:Protein of unknown function (DUF2786)
MTKDRAIEQIMRLRALAERPGTAAEGAAARDIAERLMGQHDVSADDIADRIAQDAAVHDQPVEHDAPDMSAYPAWWPRPKARTGPGVRATARSLADHDEFPDRVHMAYNEMISVCGARPTFVWTYERAIAEKSGNACPHCMDVGLLTTRIPRLEPVAARRIRDTFGRFLPKRLRG